MRHAVTISVAHGECPARAAGAALGVHPGQGRVPGDVDVPGQKGVYLELVVAVENVVDRVALLFEEFLDDVPDHDDLGVVDHGADEYGCLPHFCSPLLQLRTTPCRTTPCR